ncbi:hypothetical protein FUSO6_03235 [Fusobacterium necrophorum DAB]|uniref:Transposase IS30-like HTH domain-containing protein n=1 Tax=Fusobacterium necrophorum BL TaxID=1441732 RepID=A0AB73BT82_9FUSO|nr:helix-turn-helix domain-containing protein [Fusobacterium necrophorum]KDE60811.1 hypothetical protein FUSO3_11850 [Fusobacterium necrophorum BL]KDE69198.1 hypothetical protein FUSO7_12030 [Fusobacterium necrophorum BFTR-2]KDE70736.1 hypothetical protein FUSO6_03235 [Fusobacterium necrophorum DAB]
MSYIHLTIEKRNQIEILRKEKYSTRNIARLIGVHHSTVAREIKCMPGEYSLHAAQQDARKKMSSKEIFQANQSNTFYHGRPSEAYMISRTNCWKRIPKYPFYKDHLQLASQRMALCRQDHSSS